MKKFLYLRATLFFILGMVSQPLWADNAGYSSANFLKIGMGARAAAMADSFTGIADDTTALYWNPAGLSLTEGLGFSVTHGEWLQGVQNEYLAMSDNLGEDGALGLGFTLEDVSAFHSTLETPGGLYAGPGGLVGASDWVLSGAYAQRLSHWFPGRFFQDTRVGLKANLINQNMTAGNLGNTFSFDVGILHDFIPRRLTLGIVLLNMGPGIQGRDQPLLFKTGLGYTQEACFDKGDKLLVDLDGNLQSDTGLKFNVGSEYQMPVDSSYRAFLRAGLRPTDDLYGAAFFTLGAGLERKFEDLTAGIDYAFVPYGAVGPTHRFTLHVNLFPETSLLEAALAGPPGFKAGDNRVPLNLSANSDKGVDSWKVTLRDAQGKTLREYKGEGVPPEHLDWDGKDGEGQPVPSGSYQAQLEVRDLRHQETKAAPLTLVAQAPAPKALTDWTLSGDTLFETGKADLSEAGKRELQDAAQKLLNASPDLLVEIDGHTDSQKIRRGKTVAFKDNQELSEARANQVRNYFIGLGVNPYHLLAKGFAEKVPVADNLTPEGRAKNRRVEFKILNQPGTTPQDPKSGNIPGA